MRKTITTETIYEYDEDGRVVRKTITETEDTDDSNYYPNPWTTTPYSPTITWATNTAAETSITGSGEKANKE